MRSHLGLLALLSAGCTQYEWVPDYLVPEVCPPAQPAAPRPRPALSLEGGVVRGRVMGPGAPYLISQSVATLSGARTWQARADTAGYFRLDSVTAGKYVLTIRAIGYRSWRDTVEIVPGPEPGFEVRLEPAMLDGPCSGFELVRVKKRRTGR